MKLISLQIDNAMRIEAAYIEPSGNAIFIGGPNKAGKSSLLDSVAMLFGGKKAIPKDPIFHGAKKAKVVGVTEQYVISLSITPKGSYLNVENRDGTPLEGTPQAILARLFSPLSFNPLHFWAMDADEQVEELKRLMGLDFAELDADRERIFEERKGINAEVKRLKGLHQSMPDYPDAPKKEVDVAEVMKELKAAEAHNAEIDDKAAQVGILRSDLSRQHGELQRAEDAVKELINSIGTSQDVLGTMEDALNEMVQEDTEDLSTQITEAGAKNDKVKAVKAKAVAAATLREQETKADALTSDLKDIDEEKRQEIANAESPVPGLGFDDSGPTFNGTPLERASQAEQIDISLDIGAALNPELDILLYRGASLLDEDMRKLIVEKAKTRDMQVFLEVVGRDKDAQFIIVDGRVEGADDKEKVTEGE